MQKTQHMTKGIAALAGVAMIGALGLVTVPAATAAGTCQVNDGKWSTFVACVNGANAGSYSTIELADDVTAGTDGGLFDPSSYESLTFSSHVTIEGNGHTIQYVHFIVNNGGDLTLKNTAIDDSVSIASDSEIPVYVSNGTFTLGEGSSLDATGGSTGTRAIGIVAGDNAVVNLNSAGQPGTTAAVRSSSASVLTRNDSGSVFSDLIPGQVSNTTINITAGDIVNGHSQDNETYAINSWGADVNVSGTARVQEVYIEDANYTQTSGTVWPNLDNSYGNLTTVSSTKYPLTLDGNAQAYVTGGELTGNYKNDAQQQGKAVLLRSANATFNVRPDSEITLGGYDAAGSSQNIEAKAGVKVPANSGFAAPVQREHGASFTSTYSDTKLSQSYANAELRSFPANAGESQGASFSLVDEAKRGTSSDAKALSESTFRVGGTSSYVTAPLSPIHGAQFIYTVWTAQNEDLVATLDNLPAQLYVYGKTGYVPAYYDWYKGSEQAKGTAPTQDANDDRLFAGWYQDDTLVAALNDPASDTYPFSYFVSKDTQNVFVQRTADFNGTFTLRFLFGVPKSLAAIDKMQFDVNLKDGNTNYKLKPVANVFKQVAFREASKSENLGPAAFAQKLGTSLGDAEYFVVGYITGIPSSLANAEVSIAPAWVTADGTNVSRGETQATAIQAEAYKDQQVQYTE